MDMPRVSILILVFAVGAFRAQAAPAGRDFDFQIDSRLSTGPVTASTRVILDWPRIRTGIALEYGAEGARFLSGGVDSAIFTAGTLSPRGLFREMNDPGGYSAGSAVFLEPDRYVLDRGFSRVSRFGLVLDLPPGNDSCFFVEGNSSGTVSAGVLGVLSPADRLILSFLLRGEAFARPDLEEDTWFLETLDEAGVPSAGHGAVKIALKRRVLRVSICSGGSVAESLVPGGFVRGLLEIDLPRFETGVFSTLVSDSYFAPSGEYPDYLLGFGVSGSLSPLEVLGLEGEYTRSLGRPASIPASHVPSRDETVARLRIESGGFDLSGEWTRIFAVDSEGNYSGGDTLRAETGLRGSTVDGGLWGESAFSPYEETEYGFGTDLSIEIGRWCLEAEGDLIFSGEADLEVDLTLGFDTGIHAVKVGGVISIGDLLGVSGVPVLGWEIEAGYRFRMSRAVSK